MESSTRDGLAAAARAGASLAAALAAIAGVGAIGCAYALRRPLPRVRGETRLDGLERDVEVIRDRWGVPHLYAETLHDLFYAQGFVHAQDRLWQMELHRRVPAGAVAEVVGEPGLPTDRFFRRLGLRRVAGIEAGRLSGEAAVALEAYAAGVNAAVAAQGGRLPVEFGLLGFAPAPWTALDCLVIGKLLDWSLSTNWEAELLRGRLVERLGPDLAAALEPAYPPGHPVAATPGQDHAGPDGFALAQFREARRLLAAVAGGGASNAWAVSGARSATGRPLLANDPHLQPQLPGLWHEIHLSGAGFDVAGAGLPGVPGVAIGHNRRIAWGITMAMADSQDLYVERLHPTNPRAYEFAGRWEEAELAVETIRVKGRPAPVVEEVAITRHGPLLGPLVGEPRQALAIRASALDPGDPGAILALDRAATWEEFTAALDRWSTATLSFVYADVAGHTGYRLAGRIPIRAQGDGLAPAPGWTGQHEWTGYVPPESLPRALDPPEGYVVTANNKIVPDDYPYLISREWADGYRARRIRDLLAAERRHTVESFRELQSDLYSIPAAELRPYLLAVPPGDAVERRALALLPGWDCRITAESAAAALYEVARHYLLRNVFGAKLGDQLEHYLGLGHESLVHTHLYQIRVTSHLLRLLRERPAGWFEGGDSTLPPPLHPRGEGAPGRAPARWPRSWDEAVTLSVREAVLFLRASLGDHPRRWRWGDLHRLTFRHALGAGPLGRALSRGPLRVGGDCDTVCAVSTDVAAPFRGEGTLASYRQVIDLGDFDRSMAVLPCGQSGHPGSRRYSDMLRLWRAGKLHPMPFSRGAVLRQAADRLTLRAGPDGRAA